MIRPILAALVLLITIRAFAQDAPDSKTTGTLSGTVIDSKTSTPVPGASVQLLSRGTAGSKLATTNTEGVFVFRGLPAGRYGLNASHQGYASGSRGRSYARISGSTVTLGTGQSIDNIVIRLAPTGVIAGRITNELEKPMSQVFVEVMKRSNRDGQLSLLNARSAFSDEQGEFRIDGIAPGRYCVKATNPRNWKKGDAPSQVYVPVFYPDATDPAQAQAVELRPGEELSGIKFTLSPVHAVRVKGRISTSNGAPTNGAYVTLSQFGSNGYVNEAQSDKSGMFAIAGVPAGSYALDVQWSADKESESPSTGRTSVSVGDVDVVVPDVMVYPAAKVSGRVVIEGERKISMPRSASLIPLAGGEGALASATVQPDGSFEFPDVPQGNYRIRLAGLPSGYYVRPEADETASAIVVSHGQATAAEVHLDHGAGQIQGVIYEDTDKQVPAASARVILLPDSGRRGESDGYRMVATDRTGRFMITSVPPGEYSLLALEDADREAFGDPDLMREYQDGLHAVRVETGATLDLQLTLAIPVSK